MRKSTTRNRPCRRRARSGVRGIALIGTLWLIALLGILALGVMSLAKADYAGARSARDTAAAEGWADGAVFLTIAKLCDVRRLNDIPIDGREETVQLGPASVAVSVQDELGKIDINFAPRDLLKSLVLSAGVTADQSEAITAAIEAKRTATFSHIANALNVGDASSRVAGFPFRTIGELRSIQWIDDDLFNRISPAVTVYSQQAAVQVSTAPIEVLRALPGMDQRQLDNVFNARRAKPVTAGSIGLTEAASASGGTAGRSFTIEARAGVGQAIFTRHAVVFVTGDTHAPYKLLEWKPAENAQASITDQSEAHTN